MNLKMSIVIGMTLIFSSASRAEPPAPFRNLFGGSQPKSIEIAYLGEQGWTIYQTVSAEAGLQMIESFTSAPFDWQRVTVDPATQILTVMTPLAAMSWIDPQGQMQRLRLDRDREENWTLRWRGETYRHQASTTKRELNTAPSDSWRRVFQVATKTKKIAVQNIAEAPYFFKGVGLTVPSNSDLGEFMGRI